MKKLTLSAATLGFIAFTCSAQAQTVSVQFPGFYSSMYSALSPTSTAGVVPEANFNLAMPVRNYQAGPPPTGQQQFFGGVTDISNASLVNTSNTPIAPVLVNSSGIATTTTFDLTPINAVGGNSISSRGVQGSDLPGNDGNLTGPVFVGSAGLSLQLGGFIPTEAYDLIAYINEPDYYGASNVEASLGNSSFYLTTTAQGPAPTYSPTVFTYLQSTTTTPNAVSTDPYATANYVEFTGVSGAVLDADALTVKGIGSVTAAGLDGFQVIDIGAVPEPSTWAMMLGGLGVLAFGVRRKSALQK